jgi:hypothetical protein
MSVRNALRDMLRLWEPAAGPAGFEGLVAQALAEYTGYVFRLARSGSQFGRDAATTDAPFAIAMEAKRYGDSVPLQELVGKSTLASFVLADGIDLWVLASTVEISEGTERQLESILDHGGISLLTLDWTEAGLPPLAVLLAAVRGKVMEFATPLRKKPDLKRLNDGLEDVAGDPNFDRQLAELHRKLSPALLGLDAFRQKSGEWIESTFGSRKLAQRQFSQFLAPLEAPTRTADRPNVMRAITEAVQVARSDIEGDTLVVVLGGEGSGKTWSVANWWLSTDPRPILMLSVGRIGDLLSLRDEPLDMLARLAAHQFGRRDDITVARWRRRIDRWSQGAPSRERFAVVIDGLNETSGKPWVAILLRLMPAVRQLGGLVIATCREAYWNREVAARLPAYITASRVGILGYDDVEFADVMKRNDVNPDSLPPRLNEFMRNPRICALALTILPQLSDIEDLTVERLLMEYWRSRLQEREDLIAHNDADLRDLLIRHAREYRERRGADFNRDEWRTRSGAAMRQDGRDVANDLNEIEEGRFFDSSSGTYHFRPESLRFALGLLIADELRTAIRQHDSDLEQVLATIIDPMRGFDAVTDILISAIAVGALDVNYPDAAIAALMTACMSLQNQDDDASDALLPYIAARPDAFLDAYETRDVDRDDGRFLRFIVHASSQRTSVSDALNLRVAGWLGAWSKLVPEGIPDREARQAEWSQKIEEKLASLTGDERRWFGEHCREFARPAGLATAAMLHMLGRPQARFAGGVMAFSLACNIGGYYNWPYDELAWVLRLNRADPTDLAHAVRDAVSPFVGDGSSQLARQAAAFALRLMGTQDDEAAAEALSPRSTCSFAHDEGPDPLDPATERPEGIEEVTSRLSVVDPAVIWNHMSDTVEDDDLERNLPLLARFDPDAIRTILDRIAGTVTTRAGLPLRQLAWRLPRLAPILSEKTAAAVTQRIAEIGVTPSIAPTRDVDWMTSMMVESVLPWCKGSAQLDLLQSLPTGASYYLSYSALAKTLADREAAERVAAIIDGEPSVLKRTLIFLSAMNVEVTDALRALILRCLKDDNHEVAAAAAAFARTHADEGLDDAVLEVALPADNDRSWCARSIRAAISSAIARRGRTDLVEIIPVEHLDWVASRLPAALDRLADTIEDAVELLARPLESAAPADAIIVLEVEDNELLTRISLQDRGEKFANPLEALKAEMSDTTGERFSRRRQLLDEQLEHFLDSLAGAGALMVARRPYVHGLSELARQHGERYAQWLRMILGTTDERALRQLQNIGIALAQNYADFDAELAARAFAHLWRVEPHVIVTMGAAKHPIRYLSLFSAAASEEIVALRRRVLEQAVDDGEIERLVGAAEAVGAGEWLAAFVDAGLASHRPVDQALAITVASLRPKNDHSDAILRRTWNRGFIGDAAEVGGARYRRAAYADHWFMRAAEANDPCERWRFAELAIAAADRRQLIGTPNRIPPELRRMGGDIPDRLVKAADKATTDAKKTLFGSKRPTGLIGEMMR